MSRRYAGNMNGERYLANTDSNNKEVHDLDKESKNCQIDEVIKAGHDKPYEYLFEARADGYDDCDWCLPNSRR